MCGRYVQSRVGADLVAPLSARLADGYEPRPNWNIAPTMQVPIVVESLVEDELVRTVGPARWGLLPHWAKDKSFSSKTFNARSETVAEKPSFRSAVKHRRAIVPAEAYYEWRTEEGKKIPHLIRPKDGSMMLFAGLWERAEIEGEEIISTTILTGPAPSADDEVLRDLGALHDRTPLALSAELANEWVKPHELEGVELHGLIDEVRSNVPTVAREWEIFEVSRAVGNVRNNGPELIEPAQPEELF